MADVQQRLTSPGLDAVVADLGDASARRPVTGIEAFQRRAGGFRVRAGSVGRRPGPSLVEAGRQLGDRFLYRRTPLASRRRRRRSPAAVCGASASTPGRVDGIFRDNTD